MKKQTTFKMYYEWEFDGDPLRSHYLIDAEDEEGDSEVEEA